MSGTTNENKRQRMATNDNEWQQMTVNNSECKRVVQRMKTNESKQNRVILGFKMKQNSIEVFMQYVSTIYLAI